MHCDTTVHSSEDSRRPGTCAAFLCLLLSLLSCSQLPQWRAQDCLEQQVLVTYPALDPGQSVLVPSSQEGLTILQLQSEPPGAREDFRQGQRHLQPLAGQGKLRLRCRYRLYRQQDRQGRNLPWPPATELFPGALSIQQESSESCLQH